MAHKNLFILSTFSRFFSRFHRNQNFIRFFCTPLNSENFLKNQFEIVKIVKRFKSGDSLPKNSNSDDLLPKKLTSEEEKLKEISDYYRQYEKEYELVEDEEEEKISGKSLNFILFLLTNISFHFDKLNLYWANERKQV